MNADVAGAFCGGRSLFLPQISTDEHGWTQM